MKLDNPKHCKNRKGYKKDQLVYMEEIEQYRLINRMIDISVQMEHTNQWVRDNAIEKFKDIRIICSKKIFTSNNFIKYQRLTNTIASNIKKREDKLFNGIAKEFEKQGKKLK